MNASTQYLVRCTGCGANTSKAYARKNAGRCKACATGIEREPRASESERRNQLILECGYDAYAREEGHYG